MTFSHAALDQYETVQTEVRDTARSLGKRFRPSGGFRVHPMPDQSAAAYLRTPHAGELGNRLRAAVSHN